MAQGQRQGLSEEPCKTACWLGQGLKGNEGRKTVLEGVGRGGVICDIQAPANVCRMSDRPVLEAGCAGKAQKEGARDESSGEGAGNPAWEMVTLKLMSNRCMDR